MTDTDVKDFADCIASLLVAQASHGVSTSSLAGLGEISLRDAVVVAAASVGARLRHAWMILREQTPDGWTSADVDVIVARKARHSVKWIAGVELKWWRQSDGANAANRRRELIRDLLRAATLYSQVEHVSLVALLSTEDSWNRTTQTKGADDSVMALIKSNGLQRWNVQAHAASPAMRGAATELCERVPVPNAFQSMLVSTAAVQVDGQARATARVWSITKKQNSRLLTADQIAAL